MAQKIVLVDDDIIFTEMASAALVNFGYECVVANSGQAGLDAIATLAPDIVLCDVQMPDLDGYSVCKWMRSTSGFTATPFLMLTGNDDVESIEHAFAVGATQFIAKPINWALLPREVQYILRSSEAYDELRQSRERYALAAAATRDVLWDWNLNTNLIYFSARWQEMLGLGHEEIVSGPEAWLSKVHPEDAAGVRAEVNSYIANDADTFKSEHRLETENGEYVWVLAHGHKVEDSRGHVTRFAGSMSDITETKRLEFELRHAAEHDDLTGLRNRRYFMRTIEDRWERVTGSVQNFMAVLYVDLDGFKSINDNHGHEVGDQLIALTAFLLTECFPSDATISRIGGDEFTVLLGSDFDKKSTIEVANRSLELIAERSQSVCGVSVTASVGVAIRRSDDDHCYDLIRRADVAMYGSKSHGGGQVTVDNASSSDVLEIGGKPGAESIANRSMSSFGLVAKKYMDFQDG